MSAAGRPAAVWAAVWAGVRAAAGVPWALRGDALAALVAERAPGGAPTTPDAERRAALAAAVALRLLPSLARLPGGPWRDSCLFRAAAECRAMRAAGLPAVLRIGVAREPGAGAPGATPVAAHAWVECAGTTCRTAHGTERGAWAVLRPAG